MKNETYALTGMSCAGCAKIIESSLNSQEGVSEASVNLKDSFVNIEFDEAKISEKQLSNIVTKLGYCLLISK